MRYMTNVLLLMVLVYSISYSQDKSSIAVLELGALGISENEAKVLSDRLRTELFKTGKFTVLERDKMNEILIEQGFQLSGCTTNECVVEAGRLIGVEKMVAGNVAKLGNLYTINIRLISVQTGEVIHTATNDCRCEIETLLINSTKSVSLILAEKQTIQNDTYIKKNEKVNQNIDTDYAPVNKDKQLRYAEVLFNSDKIEDALKILNDIALNSENKDLAKQALYEQIQFAKQLFNKNEYVKSINILDDIIKKSANDEMTLQALNEKIIIAEKLFINLNSNAIFNTTSKLMQSRKLINRIIENSKDKYIIKKALNLKIEFAKAIFILGLKSSAYSMLTAVINFSQDNDIKTKAFLQYIKFTENIFESGDVDRVKLILNYIIEKSYNDDAIAKALFYKIKYGIDDSEKTFIKLKAYFPNDQATIIEAQKIVESRKINVQK